MLGLWAGPGRIDLLASGDIFVNETGARFSQVMSTESGLEFFLIEGPMGMELNDAILSWTPEEAGYFPMIVTATNGEDVERRQVILSVR